MFQVEDIAAQSKSYMFLSRKGGREHLNNTTHDFLWWRGKKGILLLCRDIFK